MKRSEICTTPYDVTIRLVAPEGQRGGYRPRILPPEVDTLLSSRSFNKRLNTMKVGHCVQLPFRLDKHMAKALQERVWRLNEYKSKEFRTFVSRKTRNFFVFRLA